ncbi:membrane-associated progesterone receptor component 1-like [Maniola jurtina]|uniref:membrane-associated progesterone receptor component 1-like n=1 Tax=Aphantopus hyperantus TaxID=2795564 RepID=UPI0015681DC2|nr:membrane-associated progesterone receptor component 1-like [Maniola hyperantus]XP_045763342.1 membrane-associated progesterone receptor component 1-like [Maniola jurtina]
MAETDAVSFWDELTSPINLVLVFFILYLVYKIVKSHFESVEPAAPPPPPMPKLRKDMTVAELKKYDGTDAEGRVLLAVNGIIFDVTRGKRFYGPGGPYSAFAGKDATRGLATGQVAASDTEYDDVSDLSPDEVASAKEWEDQFKEKYDIVGKLLKPGETPTVYSEEESEDKKSQ